VTLDRRAIGGPHALEKAAPGCGEGDHLAATVLLAGLALDIARRLQPIDQARDVVLGNQHPAFDLQRAQRHSGAAQLEQDVVPAKGRKTRLLEIGFDRAQHMTAGAHEANPCRDGGVGRMVGHDSVFRSSMHLHQG
jgi:hypothetical protein